MSQTSRLVPLFLKGAKVNPDFRDALHDAANRAGITANEFVIQAAAEKLMRAGAKFSDAFSVSHAADMGEAA